VGTVRDRLGNFVADALAFARELVHGFAKMLSGQSGKVILDWAA
jgi:hypothetical protein